MLEQAGLCLAFSETTLLVFPRDGSNYYAALPYTTYPLRMLKFEIRAEINEYDAKGRGGACTKRCFAKALRMLADPYKCLKNVAIDCRPRYRMPYKCSERLQMPLQIIRTPCKHLTNEANV